MNLRKHSSGKPPKATKNNLREPGSGDACLKETCLVISDSKDQLTYVINQTARTAECVLHAVENTQPIQDDLAVSAQKLAAQWQQILEASPITQANPQAVQATLAQTINFLNEVSKKTDLTKRHLLEILTAQSSQDLTGQVMQKMSQKFEALEQEWPQFLSATHATAELSNVHKETGLMNGPVIDHTKQPGTLANQNQVDSLLKKLGL